MTTVVVDASRDQWQSGGGLESNSAYVVVPDPSSRWRISANTDLNYWGTDSLTTASPIGSFPVRIGSLTVLVWHHQADGNHIPEVFSFSSDQRFALVRTGSHGGSMHFMCADLAGTYGDNSGVCKVDIEKDEGNGSRIRAALPITARRGSSTWHIAQNGAVECSIKYTVGSGSGTKHYASGLLVEYRDGTTESRFATKGVGRPGVGTRSGTFTVAAESLPVNKLGDIRHVYVTHNVASSIGTVRQHLDNWARIIQEADGHYRKLKDTELVKDAFRVITSTA